MGSTSWPEYNSLVDALDRTIGNRNSELMVKFLEDTGAIQGKRIDGEKVESSIRDLFGENALMFFRLLLNMEESAAGAK